MFGTLLAESPSATSTDVKTIPISKCEVSYAGNCQMEAATTGLWLATHTTLTVMPLDTTPVQLQFQTRGYVSDIKNSRAQRPQAQCNSLNTAAKSLICTGDLLILYSSWKCFCQDGGYHVVFYDLYRKCLVWKDILWCQRCDLSTRCKFCHRFTTIMRGMRGGMSSF